MSFHNTQSTNGIDPASVKPIVVTAAIIEKDGLVFAARRGPGKHLAGMWEFPGGKLENGEPPELCLQRELHEEFGIETRIGSLVGMNTHDYGSKLVELLAYRVEHLGGDFELRDHDELNWLDPKDLPKVDWAPADIPLVDQYLSTNQTQVYYSGESTNYCEESSQFDIAKDFERFLRYIPTKGHILDAGCGSGRDAKALVELGHDVTAFDYNANIAGWASSYTGLAVQVRSFFDVDESDAYDGIWASASLLHVPQPMLILALNRLACALKRGGVIYMSFKVGDSPTIDERGRSFTNLNIDQLSRELSCTDGLELIDIWTSESELRGRQQRWTNALARRV